MNNGIGKGKTREDHRGVADQLYGAYARAQEAKSLSSIVGAEALSESDKQYLKFGERFEKEFITQGPYEDEGHREHAQHRMGPALRIRQGRAHKDKDGVHREVLQDNRE